MKRFIQFGICIAVLAVFALTVESASAYPPSHSRHSIHSHHSHHGHYGHHSYHHRPSYHSTFRLQYHPVIIRPYVVPSSYYYRPSYYTPSYQYYAPTCPHGYRY